jgi:hypothetical protein
VPLDDTAYGNGNYDTTGSWDNWGYKTSEINAQTISIEHQDHGDPGGKGIVSDKTQQTSMALQALLHKGTIADWKAAGIIVRDWTHNAPILQAELRKVPLDGRHVITHHDIAGKLKPYCWLPWSSDKVGFPRDKYVAGIKTYEALLLKPAPPVVIPPPVVTPPVPCYTEAELQSAVAAAVSGATAAASAEITRLTNELLLIKQDIKSKAIAYIQTL